jgi:hypothetical protein
MENRAMIRVVGDILEAYAVELDISQEEFDALDEQEQKDAIAEQLGGGGWGAKRDVRIDFTEALDEEGL